MRGKHRTVPKEKLIAEAEFLARSGTKEIILIGQDTTDYGIDLYGERNIASLIRDISAIEGIKWIRLMYAYPSHFPEDLIDEIANNPKVVKYIDIPLQHISDVCLRSMRRGITKRATIDLIEKLRARIPDLTLRTTFILGYPAETKKEFQELCDFVSEYQFDRVGVFPYSQEENTVSYILGDPVGVKEKKRRMDALMEMQMEISARKNQQFVGKSLAVIVDGIEGEYYACRSFQDAPEVDGNVLIPVSDGTLTAGMIVDAFVYESNEYDLFAHFNPNT
jgi:ribosomal protein S12 methylthiotransferase